MPRYRVAVDTGGTFSDFVYLNEETGAVSISKVLRDEARRRGLPFKAEKWRGKGGHMMVFVGDRLTTVPSREIDPKTARKIRKQLGLAD